MYPIITKLGGRRFIMAIAGMTLVSLLLVRGYLTDQNVIAYGEPIRNTTDTDKWKAPSITADGTHALVGGVNLQRDNGVVPFYNSLPSGSSGPSDSNGSSYFMLIM